MSRVIILAGFGLALITAVALELIARRDGARVPTLGQLCAAAVQVRVGRFPLGQVILMGLWWWVGWHFFAR